MLRTAVFAVFQNIYIYIYMYMKISCISVFTLNYSDVGTFVTCSCNKRSTKIDFNHTS